MSLRERDIVRYTPASPFRRDGFAQVHIDWQRGEPYGKDTFDQNDTRLTPDELATATVLFNLADFAERPHLFEETWAPEDVVVLPTRKGMVQRKFLRVGAEMLPEPQVIARRLAIREQEEQRARAEMLSPLADQSYTSTPLPELTIDESGELIDTIKWVQRASRSFNAQLQWLIDVMNGKDGNLHIQTVLTDEDHHELVRARRTLDKKLAELRS